MIDLNDVKVVPLRENHAEAIATLECEVMLFPRDSQDVLMAIEDGSKGFVAVVNQTLVGHIQFREHRANVGSIIIINSIAVTPVLQRNRIGNELLRKLIDIVDDPTNSVTMAKCYIRKQLDESIGNFYWVHGFHRRKVHRKFFMSEDAIEYQYHPMGYTCRGRVSPLHLFPNN